jgi:hypothetical protein
MGARGSRLAAEGALPSISQPGRRSGRALEEAKKERAAEAALSLSPLEPPSHERGETTLVTSRWK